MQQQDIHTDLDILVNQLSTLKSEFDMALTGGKSFLEVKMIHLQIKELSKLIEPLKQQNNQEYSKAMN